MYYQHFGLSGPPFQFSVSPRALYRGKEHSEAWAALEWGLLHEPTGYTLLVGEPGTGKTTLIGSLLAQHSHRLIAAYLNHPRLPVDDLLRLALRQLGVDPPPASKADCLETFRAIMRTADPQRCIGLVIDEAQELSPDAFEEFRLLSEYTRIDGCQLQMAFVGQPNILQILEQPALLPFNQRIGARAVLNPLAPREAFRYVEHRLRACNGSANRIFAAPALHELIARGHGIPRRLNVLGHNSMLAAYSSGARRVRRSDVLAVASEYENLRTHTTPAAPPAEPRSPEPKRRRFWQFWRPARPTVAAASIFLIGVGLAQLWLRPRPGTESSPLHTAPLAAFANRTHRTR
jgi:general secretion pathway protein A